MARWAIALVQLMLVPAWWLARYLPFAPPQRMVRWLVGATIGPALVAVLYMWAAAAHVVLPVPLLVWGLWVGTVVMLWRVWHASRDAVWYVPTWGWLAATAICTGLVIWTRVTQVEHLVFPPWVDAVHHALLIRVAYEQGHAPWSLLPYLPVTQLPFHSGFHSVMAFLMHMSGMTVDDIPIMLLYGGQILNVLAVISGAAMAWVWWRQWPAVVMALVVAGIVSIMPAFYLSWSRYTLLAGMTLLPVAMVALDGLWHDDERLHWVWYAVPLIALSLVHMAVFVMALAWGIVCVVGYGRPRGTTWYAAALAVCVTLPWWLFVWGQSRSGAGASAMHVVGNATQNAFIDGLFWARTNRWLVPAFVLIGLRAVAKRTTRMVLLLIWVLVVAVLANPWLIRLPYLSFFTNETVATALYLPITLGFAWLAVHSATMVGRAAGILPLLLVVWAFANVGAMEHVVRDDTVLATVADRDALRWIAAELPATAVIATNTSSWMWHVDRGSDGGWWALPLTGRMVTTPPVLYTYGDDAWVAQVSATTAQLRVLDGSPAQIVEFVQNHPEVTHIYASERGIIKPSTLRGIASFDERYHTGDVAIFAIIR